MGELMGAVPVIASREVRDQWRNPPLLLTVTRYRFIDQAGGNMGVGTQLNEVDAGCVIHKGK